MKRKEDEKMRRIPLLLALTAGLSTLALAESFSGNLLDASCYESKKTAASCDASSATTAFALDVSGKVYKLDESGNTKASVALKNRAARANTSTPTSAAVKAKVEGTEKSGTIEVQSLDIE